MARRHLAEQGAAALSVRAVARELGMASSAIYRYVTSRDDLLTLLIVEAYDAVGEVAEQAAEASRRRAPRRRWVTVAAAVRAWALANPHEYALVYGSPVPGYEAPVRTTASGTRVSFALLSIVRDAAAKGQLGPPQVADVPPRLAADLDQLRTTLDLHVGDETLLAVLLAWTQLFGLLSFELFNQTRGVVSDDEALFDAATTAMATAIGLQASAAQAGVTGGRSDQGKSIQRSVLRHE